MHAIEIYTGPDKQVQVEVTFENDTFWLSLNQISELFERDKSVISRHLKNIFKSEELSYSATVAKNATVQFEAGKFSCDGADVKSCSFHLIWRPFHQNLDLGVSRYCLTCSA